MPTPSRIYLSSPHMGGDELKLVQEAFATNWIAPLGPHVDAFEKEFAAAVGAKYAAALSSGTAAIHLGLRMLGVSEGDEVFVSSLTFSASVNPIAYERGRPVFIDSDRASWNMDPARLEEALADRAKKGKLPKAVIAVHLYGQSANIGAIAELCARYNVPLIEDAAEALGAAYYRSPLSENRSSANPTGAPLASPNNDQRVTSNDSRSTSNESRVTNNAFRLARPEPHAPNNGQRISNNEIPIAPGTLGLMGIFSFNGNKIITTSGGGMLVSSDEALIKKARFLATQARDPAPHYQHSEIGFNYRMSNVLAAIGRGQLRVLKDRVEARRANTAFYQKAFAGVPGIEFMPEAPWGRCTRWLTCILVDPAKFGVDRDGIRLALEKQNIESRPVWKPMHLQPVFASCDHFGGEVAEDLFTRGLCLPSGSNLTEPDLQRVVEAVLRCRRG